MLALRLTLLKTCTTTKRFFTEMEDHIQYMKNCMAKAGMVKKALSPERFDEISKATYNKLHSACKQLCMDYEKRGSFVEDTVNGRIQVSVKSKGVYELWIDRDRQIIYYFSPVSGTHRYWYEAQNGVWLSEDDMHNLIQKIAKDLMVIGPMNI